MIGYYVHHHGRGHLTRALAISQHLDEDVVFFSSLPRPRNLRPGDDWVQLPSDVPEELDRAPVDPTANGRLHWVPLGVDGLADRSALLLGAIAGLRPRRVVIDVSVEVALLVRLAGAAVTVMAMPGDRDDAVHRLAYDIADQIIAPWADEVYRPPWLDDHADRTHYIGCVSRFDGLAHSLSPHAGTPHGLLLGGAGGSGAPADALEQLRSATPEYRWVAAGGGAGWVDDLWPLLVNADVVVTHAGQNAIADVALARACAVVVPERRPYNEQHATAASVADAGIAVAVTDWPAADQWPELLARSRTFSPRHWRRMRVEGAAARAAAVISA